MKPCQKEAAAESVFCARKLRAPEEAEHFSKGESSWERNGGYSSGHPGAPVIWPRAVLLGGSACWVPVFRLWPPAGQHITCFMCFCLKTPYLIYIFDSLTLSLQPRALKFAPEESLPSKCTFSVRHITVFLCLGTPESTSAL